MWMRPVSGPISHSPRPSKHIIWKMCIAAIDINWSYPINLQNSLQNRPNSGRCRNMGQKFVEILLHSGRLCKISNGIRDPVVGFFCLWPYGFFSGEPWVLFILLVTPPLTLNVRLFLDVGVRYRTRPDLEPTMEPDLVNKDDRICSGR